MKLRSNHRMASARQEESFRKGEYRGLDVSKIPIRSGALEILGKPSLMFGKLVQYKSIFNKESDGGVEERKSDGLK